MAQSYAITRFKAKIIYYGMENILHVRRDVHSQRF